MVGVAGGAEKCTCKKDELGFGAIVNYKSDDLDGALVAACPDDIHIYFESMDGARAPICGYMSNYNSKDST